MIYNYTVQGDPRTVDTGSATFADKMAWIARDIGSGLPSEAPYVTVDGKTGQIHQALNMAFAIPGHPIFLMDAYLCDQSPKTAVNCVALGLNLPGIRLDGPEYAPPAPPARDWEVEGSPIGQPLASASGCYQYKWTHQAIGATVTGPISNFTYTLVELGNGLFSRLLAWKVS